MGVRPVGVINKFEQAEIKIFLLRVRNNAYTNVYMTSNKVLILSLIDNDSQVKET